jgi:hypothetical protein
MEPPGDLASRRDVTDAPPGVAAYPDQPAAEDPGEHGPGLLLKPARATPPKRPWPGAPSAAPTERATNAGRSGHAFAGASCPARDRAVSTTGAGPVCNRNRVLAGDCHDGLWGQLAVWPSSLVRVAWGARRASALSPLVAAGSPRLVMGRAGGAAGHLAVFCNASPGCPPVQYRPRHEPGKGWCTHPPEGLRPGSPAVNGRRGVASVTCPQTNRRGARG